jgi:hypothetical protein
MTENVGYIQEISQFYWCLSTSYVEACDYDLLSQMAAEWEIGMLVLRAVDTERTV